MAKEDVAVPLVDKVDAPWDDDQVRSLNEYQMSGLFHEYTGPTGKVLVAGPSGWHEPDQAEGAPPVQTWAHRWTTDWTWKRQRARSMTSGGRR